MITVQKQNIYPYDKKNQHLNTAWFEKSPFYGYFISKIYKLPEDFMDAEKKRGIISLIPFVIFAVFYLGLSLASGDFYRVPMIVAFLVASAAAFALHPVNKLEENMLVYTRGMGDVNIMMMCLIFILAGAFASVAKATGAVDSAVAISRYFIPASLILPGMFVVSCFISLAIGTSCGTIAAVTPIAVTITKQLGIPTELMLGCVVGGSMFGDNMSMISDTTIAATRSLGISMRDKFISNVAFAAPAAVIAVTGYLVFGYTKVSVTGGAITISATDFLLASPYVIILLLSLLGGNVIALLTGATVLTACIGIFAGKFDFWHALDFIGKGCLNMSETLIVAIRRSARPGKTLRRCGFHTSLDPEMHQRHARM